MWEFRKGENKNRPLFKNPGREKGRQVAMGGIKIKAYCLCKIGFKQVYRSSWRHRAKWMVDSLMEQALGENGSAQHSGWKSWLGPQWVWLGTGESSIDATCMHVLGNGLGGSHVKA